MSVEKTLDAFGKYIVQQSRTNLSKKGKKDTGALYNGISYKLNVSKNSFELSFDFGSANDYWEFVDKGVRGVSSSNKAPNSPFKFGSGSGRSGGLTSGIDEWVKRKRLQFKDRDSGKFMSYKSTAFLIRNSIWNKGLENTEFFSKPFENAFKRLPDDIIEVYGLDIDNLLKYSLK